MDGSMKFFMWSRVFLTVIPVILSFCAYGIDSAGEYKRWKEGKDLYWKETPKYLTFEARIKDLFHCVEKSLKKPGQVASLARDYNEERVVVSRSKEDTLFCYNYLRELLLEPVIKSVEQIDKKWLGWAGRATSLSLLKKVSNGELFAPNITQEQLLRGAQILAGINEGFAVFSAKMGKCNVGWIAIPESNNIDHMIFSINHELGHRFHKDGEMRIFLGEKARKSKKSLGEIYAKENKTNPKIFRDLKVDEGYVNLAEKTIDTTSEMGAKIRGVLDGTSELGKKTRRDLKKYGQKKLIFWIPPKDEAHYASILNGRWREFGADLFAADQLLKQNELETILSRMKNLITIKKVFTIGNEDVHPSPFERALALAGFLISQGLDINKSLRSWERLGMCSASRQWWEPIQIRREVFKILKDNKI